MQAQALTGTLRCRWRMADYSIRNQSVCREEFYELIRDKHCRENRKIHVIEA